MGIADEFALGHIWTIESYFEGDCSPFGDRSCVERWVDALGPKALRRPLTDDDRTFYLSVYDTAEAEVLAENSTFEETTWLLWTGTLPTRAQLEAFKEELRPYYALAPELVTALKALPRDGHPMEALQAMVAMLGMVSPACDLKDEAAV